MKKHVLFALALVALVGCAAPKSKQPAAAQTVPAKPAAPAVAVTATNAPTEPKAAFANDNEKAGYALGLNLATNWKRQGLEGDVIDFDAITRGLKDAQTGGKPQLVEEEIRSTLTALQQRVKEKLQQAGVKNKVVGEKFLAENQTKPGVIALTNGLQYKIITAGTGESPKRDDMVTVKYAGTLIDGSEFDSTAKHGGNPSTFRVDGVIPGWTQALQLMQPGAKWELFIPSELAYGESGRPGIPPNSVLIFEVELISVTAPPPVVMPAMTPSPTSTPQPITSDIIRVPSAEEMKKGAKIETIKADQIPHLTNPATNK
jgi:FKBP-type peptidyl-prolyl cis-trans isomerase